ncbi:hypothetical protein PHSY_001582 [Pseudozyma hubeiensis SY62]|uniref:Uncharacterized protein n=1 Tax=Pseudozyma hubeiensis (strain SY62) TaxID=1305764 RepID=R9NYU9_PSEHS|nr:hypothetical protein PHSY_001582 [Pseudozyma hubeiensis SY62]GAC94013.1 hypothetical protein PHSY_001582 [Pseudozyma hubeiensis SY62]
MEVLRGSKTIMTERFDDCDAKKKVKGIKSEKSKPSSSSTAGRNFPTILLSCIVIDSINIPRDLNHRLCVGIGPHESSFGFDFGSCSSSGTWSASPSLHQLPLQRSTSRSSFKGTPLKRLNHNHHSTE